MANPTPTDFERVHTWHVCTVSLPRDGLTVWVRRIEYFDTPVKATWHESTETFGLSITPEGESSAVDVEIPVVEVHSWRCEQMMSLALVPSEPLFAVFRRQDFVYFAARMCSCLIILLCAWGAWFSLPTFNARAAEAQTNPAGRRNQSVLAYLKGISGTSTVAGIHNREPNGQPTRQTDRIFQVTSRYPGLWSGDFLFSADDVTNRWTMIRECRRQWDQGAIVQLMLHVAPPNQPEVCAWRGGILSRLSDEQWRELVTDGGALNRAWKSRLDGYAVYLWYLQTNGVTVLFRPHHEMNQRDFWWGGRKGADGTARLYRITHDYLTRSKGLTNLVWVWDMQDLSHDFAEYNPGDGYWDVFAFDVYGDGYEQSWYEYILPIAGDKPMAIGECEKLPTPDLLTAQPRWCLFMSWAELTFNRNSSEKIRELYLLPRVITLDRLPRFE